MKVSNILTVKSYIETLKNFSVGDVRKFRIVGTDYTGFHNAKSRLLKKGFDFQFSRNNEKSEFFMIIKRTK